jgi:hypothetical protein
MTRPLQETTMTYETHPAYLAGRAAKTAEIAEIGFVAARDMFNLDVPHNVVHGTAAGLFYARGERDALLDFAMSDDFTPVGPTVAEGDAARIARLINTLQSAENMLAARDENGERTYDFWLWHTERCTATVTLAEEFGIELVNLSSSREYLAQYPTDPKYAVAI